MAAPQLFDFITAIRNTKENLVLSGDAEVEKSLASNLFMIRRGLSQSMDSIVTAQKMNKIHSATPWMQWNLAFHEVPKTRKYDKWAKKGAVDPDILLLSQYFYINTEKASEYLKFLPASVLEEIREKVKNCESNEKAKPRKAK